MQLYIFLHSFFFIINLNKIHSYKHTLNHQMIKIQNAPSPQSTSLNLWSRFIKTKSFQLTIHMDLTVFIFFFQENWVWPPLFSVQILVPSKFLFIMINIFNKIVGKRDIKLLVCTMKFKEQEYQIKLGYVN